MVSSEGEKENIDRSRTDMIGPDNSRAGLQEQFGDLDIRGADYLPLDATVEEVAGIAASAPAGKKTNFSVSMGEIFNVSPARDRREVASRRSRERHDGGGDLTSKPVTAGSSVVVVAGEPGERSVEIGSRGQGREGDNQDVESVRSDDDEMEIPDEAYMHSLGYGNLSTVLPILLDRRVALEVSLFGVYGGFTVPMLLRVLLTMHPRNSVRCEMLLALRAVEKNRVAFYFIFSNGTSCHVFVRVREHKTANYLALGP